MAIPLFQPWPLFWAIYFLRLWQAMGLPSCGSREGKSFYLPDAFYDDSRPAGFASAVYHDGQDGAGQYAFGDYPSVFIPVHVYLYVQAGFFMGFQRNWRRPRVSTGLAGSEPISGLSCQSQECCWQPSLFLILPARGTRTWYLPRLSAHRRNMFWW